MIPVTETEEFKKLASELYKKNLDLFNANRTLTILQKLYQIMASALKMEDMTKQYLDVIVSDMNFLSGLVFVKHTSEDFLRPVAQAKTDFDLKSLKIPLNNSGNMLANTYNSKQRKSTTNLDEAFSFITDNEKVEQIKAKGDIKSIVSYPIIFGDTIFGVFIISMGVAEESLSQTDNSILDRVSTVFGIALDRLTLYLNLQYANERLKFLDQQKDEFLNIASHELRAPMTAIKGYISMTQNGDGGEVPVAAQELLAEAAAENDRMIRLVNNMLNVARIEEGRMVYEEGEVKLSEVVARVFDEVKFDAENKALAYTYKPAEDISDLVITDVDRIHEVVSNLINNAVKYTDSGKVEVILSNPSPAIVRFEVEDSGPGMTADEVGKLFQKFYRAESYVGKAMGTGLGLYISKLLVEKFNGTIGVKSEKGKGSLFWFELPVKT